MEELAYLFKNQMENESLDIIDSLKNAIETFAGKRYKYDEDQKQKN